MVQLPHPTEEREVDHECCTLYFLAWTRRSADGLPDARRDGLSHDPRARLHHTARNARLQHIAGVLRHACLGLFHDDRLRWLPSWIRRPSLSAPRLVAAQGSPSCAWRAWGTWRIRRPWRAREACGNGAWRSATCCPYRPIAFCSRGTAASSRRPAYEVVHYETIAEKEFVRKGVPIEGRCLWERWRLAREGHHTQEKVIARGQRAAACN